MRLQQVLEGEFDEISVDMSDIRDQHANVMKQQLIIQHQIDHLEQKYRGVCFKLEQFATSTKQKGKKYKNNDYIIVQRINHPFIEITPISQQLLTIAKKLDNLLEKLLAQKFALRDQEKPLTKQLLQQKLSPILHDNARELHFGTSLQIYNPYVICNNQYKYKGPPKSEGLNFKKVQLQQYIAVTSLLVKHNLPQFTTMYFGNNEQKTTPSFIMVNDDCRIVWQSLQNLKVEKFNTTVFKNRINFIKSNGATLSVAPKDFIWEMSSKSLTVRKKFIATYFDQIL